MRMMILLMCELAWGGVLKTKWFQLARYNTEMV